VELDVVLPENAVTTDNATNLASLYDDGARLAARIGVPTQMAR
jgi:hypothetical protein